MRLPQPISATIGLAILSLFAGCFSNNDGLDATVTGTVTMGGAPLSSVMVEFTPIAGDQLGSYGVTDAEGHYQLGINAQRKGIFSGDYRVQIREHNTSDAAEAIKRRIPKKYNQQSTLEETVAPGQNTIDFELSPR